jgi:glycosyltransferase involved in cell wall biosynthesis
MIKVAIDSGPTKSGDAVRGIGVHTANLVKYSRNLKDLDIDVVDFSKVDLGKYDIAHYQKFNPYFFSVPFIKKTKTVLTIHDLIYLVYPKHYPPGIKGRIRLLIQKFLVKKADAVVTISETSKKDIVRFLGIPQEKLHVIYLAPREIFRSITDQKLLNKIKNKYNLPDRFVLYVGDVNYNKNVLGLCKACKLTKIPLVIAGKQAASKDFDWAHPENKPLVKLLKEYGDDPSVMRVGFVTDEDLVGIYNLASLYCQPAFYEGFGLPVLEAMASGCPVVASKTQALVEIAEPAAIFADPKDPADIAGKISMVLKDLTLRTQLVETGKVLVKKYSWEKVARATHNVYKEVLK